MLVGERKRSRGGRNASGLIDLGISQTRHNASIAGRHHCLAQTKVWAKLMASVSPDRSVKITKQP